MLSIPAEVAQTGSAGFARLHSKTRRLVRGWRGAEREYVPQPTAIPISDLRGYGRGDRPPMRCSSSSERRGGMDESE